MDDDRRASFLADVELDEQVQRLYASDLDQQGYVANQTRLWAHAPEALALLSYVLRRAADVAALDASQRALLVTASASSLGDSYCSTAFGIKLAAARGGRLAAQVVAGDDSGLDETEAALARWARQVVRDPNAATAEQVDELRAVGYDDRQIHAVTLFVALRIAYSSVNDALGAAPDVELAERVPAAVAAAVSFGRRPAPRR